MSALFVSSDLMFGSRVSSTAKSLGVPLKIVANPGVLPEVLDDQSRLVIVDLSQPGLDLGALVETVRTKAAGCRIIAFGPHVNEAMLASAKAVGCDAVMPNSQFNQSMGELLRLCLS